jgi:hypothetical protein
MYRAAKHKKLRKSYTLIFWRRKCLKINKKKHTLLLSGNSLINSIPTLRQREISIFRFIWPVEFMRKCGAFTFIRNSIFS